MNAQAPRPPLSGGAGGSGGLAAKPPSGYQMCYPCLVNMCYPCPFIEHPATPVFVSLSRDDRKRQGWASHPCHRQLPV